MKKENLTRPIQQKVTCLLPLMRDFVFKAVYGRDTPECKAALIALLNQLLGREENPIVDLSYKNPFNIKTYLEDKETAMDIKVTLFNGELVDLEMQVGHLDQYRRRSIFYSGKLISESLQEGERYSKMRESIVISILNGTLFPNYTKLLSTYYWKEDTENCRLDTVARIMFLELGKIDVKKKPISEMTSIERLAAYFKYVADPEMKQYIDEIRRYEDEVIRMTQTILETISSDEQMRELADAKLKYNLGYNTDMYESYMDGVRDGREEGVNALIGTLKELNISKAAALEKLIEKFSLSEKEAMEYLERYW